MYNIIYSHEGITVADQNMNKWAVGVVNIIKDKKEIKEFMVGSLAMIDTIVRVLHRNRINKDKVRFVFDKQVSFIDKEGILKIPDEIMNLYGGYSRIMR